MTRAYSFNRLSNPQQLSGPLLDRQSSLAHYWCRDQGLELDTSFSLPGKTSALSSLTAFLDAVKSGRIPSGSHLLFESIDRLTRESRLPTMILLLNLIEAGVRIVHLDPGPMVFDKDTDPLLVAWALSLFSQGQD